MRAFRKGFLNTHIMVGVSSDESVEALEKHFTLLLPPFYEGEGFASTLIDAYSARISNYCKLEL